MEGSAKQNRGKAGPREKSATHWSFSRSSKQGHHPCEHGVQRWGADSHWCSLAEVKMAKVPDLFEDLKNCYSENEEYNSAIDHLSLNQKSFYEASYGSLHEKCTDKFVSLRASETSKMSNFTFEESLVMVAATSDQGKVLKKRRLGFDQVFAEDGLEAMTHNLEETIQSDSAPRVFQNNVIYKRSRLVKSNFVMNDSLNQNICLDVDKVHLRAVPLTDLQHEVKFDMYAYSSDDSKYPVTLKLSNTQLFVSAQGEDEPVLLKELPETPKVITGSEVDLVFFWQPINTKNYFTSAAYPELFIATKEQSRVHLAKGLPSMTDFQIS